MKTHDLKRTTLINNISLNRIKEIEEWRKEGYPWDYSAIAEILNFNLYEDDRGNKVLRYLRKAQFEALEIYWYLRVVEKTPYIFDLYKKLYGDPVELSQIYRLNLDKIYNLMKNACPDGDVPISHIIKLRQQIESQTKKYEITEEEVEVALALVKKGTV